MKDFGVNGIQCIVDAMFKSQREEMVEHASEIEAGSGPSDAFYLSPKERPTAEPCQHSDCKKMSGTANKNQLHWIEVQLTRAISGGHQLPLQIDPPKPCWRKHPVLDDYLLKPLLIVNPENLHDVKFNLKCLQCVSES